MPWFIKTFIDGEHASKFLCPEHATELAESDQVYDPLIEGPWKPEAERPLSPGYIRTETLWCEHLVGDPNECLMVQEPDGTWHWATPAQCEALGDTWRPQDAE